MKCIVQRTGGGQGRDGGQSTLCNAQGGSKVKDRKDEKDEKDRGTRYSVGRRPGIMQKHRA